MSPSFQDPANATPTVGDDELPDRKLFGLLLAMRLAERVVRVQNLRLVQPSVEHARLKLCARLIMPREPPLYRLKSRLNRVKQVLVCDLWTGIRRSDEVSPPKERARAQANWL